MLPHEKLIRQIFSNLPSALTQDQLELTEVRLVDPNPNKTYMAEIRFKRMQEYQWFCKRARAMSRRADIREIAIEFLDRNKLFVDIINRNKIRDLMDETFARAFYRNNRRLHERYSVADYIPEYSNDSDEEPAF